MCNIRMYEQYVFLFLKSNNNIICFRYDVLRCFSFEVLFKCHVKTT